MMNRSTPILLIACFIVAAFTCENNNPEVNNDQECERASCCNPEFNAYVEYVNDVPVRLIGETLESSIAYPSDNNNPNKSSIFSICEKSLDKIKGLTPDNRTENTANPTYSYKVSGKVLADVKNPRLAATPVLSIYIDKIEIIKK